MMKSYIIEIDAQEAFSKIGVDLTTSPIAAECIEMLRQHLSRCVTPDASVIILAKAVRAAKPRRVRKQSGDAGKTKTGGQTDGIQA